MWPRLSHEVLPIYLPPVRFGSWQRVASPFCPNADRCEGWQPAASLNLFYLPNVGIPSGTLHGNMVDGLTPTVSIFFSLDIVTAVSPDWMIWEFLDSDGYFLKCYAQKQEPSWGPEKVGLSIQFRAHLLRPWYSYHECDFFMNMACTHLKFTRQ